MVGLNNLKGPFQPRRLYDSMMECSIYFSTYTHSVLAWSTLHREQAETDLILMLQFDLLQLEAVLLLQALPLGVVLLLQLLLQRLQLLLLLPAKPLPLLLKAPLQLLLLAL